MNFEYLVKIENMSEEGVQAFQGIANKYEHLRDALSSDPEETFGIMREEIEEIECYVESRSGMILGFIKSGYPDSIPELFTRLHQNLIDAKGAETRAVIHIFEENYQYYASYLLESSDDDISTIKDSCILDHHGVHGQIIAESEGSMEIQAEIYADLNVELDEDWDWDDVIYPNPERIMESGVYYNFFYDNALSVFRSLQEECGEMWRFQVQKY
ncbi:hypothetical protein N9E85_00605 [Gammaproteobacteria bacterium]|mgnify:CR=1 FL=1|jgi:hypothetical protein|nr:hypothetical protein [Gammaproteobacteria bacterium]